MFLNINVMMVLQECRLSDENRYMKNIGKNLALELRAYKEIFWPKFFSIELSPERFDRLIVSFVCWFNVLMGTSFASFGHL